MSGQQLKKKVAVVAIIKTDFCKSISRWSMDHLNYDTMIVLHVEEGPDMFGVNDSTPSEASLQLREEYGMLCKDEYKHRIEFWVKISPDTVSNAIISVIQDLIKKHDASVTLVIGNKKMNALQRLMGSTSEELFRNCPCPLVVVRPEMLA